jgi:hypothetical protein
MSLLEEIITQVSNETGIPRRIVDRTYRAYWRAIREYITSLPLKEELTDEEFLKLKPNVNIPSLGKLNVTLKRYKRVKSTYNKIKEIKNLKDKEDAAYQED